jgi:hypothetical protein
MYGLIVALAATKVIPAGIGLYHFRSLKPALKIVTILIVLGAINEVALFLLAKPGGNNLYLIHVFAAVEVTMLLIFYGIELKSPGIKKSWRSMAVAVVCFAIAYASYKDNLFNYPSEPRAINAIIIIILSVIFFYEIATTGDSVDPLRNGSYFINGGVMLYFTATFITWLMMKYVLDDKSIVYALYGSHAYINAFCNLVFAYGYHHDHRYRFHSL